MSSPQAVDLPLPSTEFRAGIFDESGKVVAVRLELHLAPDEKVIKITAARIGRQDRVLDFENEP